MSTRVYDWDQNPKVDRFAYRCSDTSAESSVESGTHEYVTDGDGRRAIQRLTPIGQRANSLITEDGHILAVSFLSAWKKLPSGGIPVWQMRKTFLHALQLEGL